MILANHGTVSFGESVERAYWWTEILDAYCRILMLARGLGKINYFSQNEARELLDLKQKWGFSDARLMPGMENCDICANDIFRDSWQKTGVERRAFDPPPPMPGGGGKSNGAAASAASLPADQEQLVKIITDRVMAALASKA
jgi:L-fuculose-phosphate aldolase